MEINEEKASAGHKLGQLIGDWLEEFLVWPLLAQVAKELDLFLDTRFIRRPIRGDKITWKDERGTAVDYDFVLELDGSEDKKGLPVAFLECCWRRGGRHSKDKARDDSGKLLPMRETHSTTRFLGIIWAGYCTAPARDLLRNHDIDLFYIPKDKIIEAFKQNGLVIDYPDKTPEEEKQRIGLTFESEFTKEKRVMVAQTLIDLVGKAAVEAYAGLVRARLTALPQEIRIIFRHESVPVVFVSVKDVTSFLEKPSFEMDHPSESFVYQVTYSDGVEFEQVVDSIDTLRNVHASVQRLANHVESQAQQKSS